MAYFILTTVVDIWFLALRWNNLKHSWTGTFLFIFIAQRFCKKVLIFIFSSLIFKFQWQLSTIITIKEQHSELVITDFMWMLI